MVDLFAINDFIRYLHREYPKIKVSVKYDPVLFILYIQIEPRIFNKDIDYYSGQTTAYDTKTCIAHINDAFIAYLAYLSHRRVKL